MSINNLIKRANGIVRETENNYFAIRPIGNISPLSFVTQDKNEIQKIRKFYIFSFLIFVVLLVYWWQAFRGSSHALKWPSLIGSVIGIHILIYIYVWFSLKTKVIYKQELHGKFKDRVFI